MLEQMAAGKGRLTPENYGSYLEAERTLYETFDYGSLFDQEDPLGNTISDFFEN